MKRQLKKRRGFTLIEVIIAAALFSFLMIGVVGAIINALYVYVAANSSRDNQQAVRNITEEIGRRVQFAEEAKVFDISATDKVLCVKANSERLLYFVIGGELKRKKLGSGSCIAPGSSDVSDRNTGAEIISAESVSIMSFLPEYVENKKQSGDSIDAQSIDLYLQVRQKSAITMVGFQQKYYNEYQVRVAFFLLNQ